MKKSCKAIVILIFICFGTTGLAQNIHFVKSFGNTGYDFGRDVKQTKDTGFVVTGSSSSFISADADAFLLKTDSLGNFEWSYNYGGSGSDWGESLTITYDSAYAIGGYTNSFGAGGFDFYFVRTNQLGVPTIEKTYGGSNWDKCYGIASIPADSGFVLVGETYSFGAGGKDIYVVRINQFGDTIWTKTFGGLLDDYAKEVIVDGDSIVVCGATELGGAQMDDGIILKLGLDGTVGWQKIVGMAQDDYFTSIVRAGGFYCLGGSKSYSYSTDYADFWVYKISVDGLTVLGDTTWNGDQLGFDIVNDIAVEMPINVVYYAGSTTSWGSIDVVDGITDCFISKLDFGYGWMPYVQNFGDVGTDVLYAVELCYDNGLIAVGDLERSSTGGNNVLLVKIDANNSFGYISLFDDVTYENITLSINSISEEKQISIYPNPTDGIVHINGFDTMYSLRVLNIMGQEIEYHKNHPGEIDLRNYQNGTYIIEISSNENRYIYKILKF